MTNSQTSARSDRGSVVLVTLVVACLLTALGVSLATLASMERAIAPNFQRGQQALYSVEALAEFVVAELVNRGDWTPVLSGADRSAFFDATFQPTTAWRTSLDLLLITGALQQRTDASHSGPNAPHWQLFASGPFDRLAGTGPPIPVYLVAWVADDIGDGDGDPDADANGAVTLRVMAVSVGGLQRSVQVALKRRPDDSSVTAAEQVENQEAASPTPELARFLPDSSSSSAAPAGVAVLSWREVH